MTAPTKDRKPSPICKARTILFSSIPPGQTAEAYSFLSRIPDIGAELNLEKRAIHVCYDLHQHSLQELEDALEDRGFRLECALLNKIIRALVHYVEETELHNLEAPQRLLKRSQHEAYTLAWEQHKHGDHDDTPKEWREYR